MISKRKNKFNFRDNLYLSDIEEFEKTISLLTDRLNHWILDFKNLAEAPMAELLGLVCQILSKRNEGHTFDIIAPKKKSLEKEWRDKNILHLMDNNYKVSNYQGSQFYPAKQYTDSDQHFNIVNNIFRIIISGAKGIIRTDCAALEWAINEVSDNVLVHSESPIGGVLIVNKIDKTSRKINFLVADCGKGVTKTLGEVLQGTSEVTVLHMAIREGVTRDKQIGQGNGLFGSHEISCQGKGLFKIISNNAWLQNKKGKLEISKLDTIYRGTIVEATVDFSQDNLMARALTINGKQFSPVDFIETGYEDPDKDHINFIVKDEANSFGTRSAGALLKDRLINLSTMFAERIIINFDNSPLISSSFADEVVGKLLIQLGEVVFRNRFVVVCSDIQNNTIIQRSVAQRLSDLNIILAEVA